MTRIASFAATSTAPATAMLRLSPDRRGISGSAQLTNGEPVPIANLLTRVLAKYGLPDRESKNGQVAGDCSRQLQLDLRA